MPRTQLHRHFVVIVGCLGFAAHWVAAQAPVPVGAGSYAEYTPPHEGGNPNEMNTRTIYVTPGDHRPIPTNDWWTDLLASRYAGALWSYPIAVTADAQGLDIFLPTEFNGDGTHMMRREPIEVQGVLTGGGAFAPVDARASSWSDWLVSFQMAQDATHKMDVTIGHGLPCVWMEFTGVSPKLVFGAARYFNDANATITLPQTTDHIGIEYAGRTYGVFAPNGTQFTTTAGGLNVTFAGADTYLVVAAMPAANRLAMFNTYAYAIPRSSTMEWELDAEASIITTTWTIDADPLKGTNVDVLQGWIPHHYRTTAHDLAFNGAQYRTPRGILKLAPGHEFHITYPFHGIMPGLSAPQALGLANDFDAGRMEQYLAMAATVTSTAADTYWGGKDIQRMGRYLTMARELHNPVEENLKQNLRNVLRNWFTYTPGETEFYFADYPRWGGLVGFNESYNSGAFTDVHFHYGYHILCTALLGMSDPQFITDYGDMAKLVAKSYANWDRTDTSSPFLRTFDIWAGFSYAAGLSSADGNNQESSAEAIQSWGGLFLLGAMVGDDDMRAAGAMGYTLETAASEEYWMDYQGFVNGLGNGNFSPIYRYAMAGIVNNQGQVHQTYFSPDPAWLRGIQWIPPSPFLSYLVKDKAFAEWHYDQMMAERNVWAGAAGNTIASMGTELANIVLGYVQMYDADGVAAQLDQFWAANHPIATENFNGGIVYFDTHANRLLGDIQWNSHTSVPTSQVYYNAGRSEWSYLIYNPSFQHQLARVYNGSTLAGYVLAAPRKMPRATQLLAPRANFAVVATIPEDGALDAPISPAEVTLAFSRPVNVATLAGATIVGPGATGLQYVPGDDDHVAAFEIEGELEAGATYDVTIPATTAAEGGAMLGAAYTFSFTLTQGAGGEGSYLRAHYTLDETAGTVAVDSSGHDLDGAYLNGITLGAAGAAATTATSVQLDGVNDHVRLPTVASLGLGGDFTVSAWVRLDATNGDRPILGTDAFTAGTGLNLGVRDGKAIFSFLNNDTLGTQTLSAGVWKHLAFRFYDGEQAIFVNGLRDAASGGHANFAGFGNVLIGRWAGSSGTPRILGGRVDDVQIYSRPLTDAEVLNLYNNPGAVNTDGWQNFPPTVDAGNDLHLRLSQPALLQGVIGDDGLPDPPAAVTSLWTKVSGFGLVSFEDATSTNTSATFSRPGTYVLRLTAADGVLTGHDDVVVSVAGELLAHYKLDETSGTAVVDSSGNGLGGTFMGGPLLGQPGVAGGTGTSVDFNGTTQDAALGSPAMLNGLVNNFTIMAWIRPDPTSGYKIIFGAGWENQNGWSLRLLDGQLCLERLGPTQLYNSGVALATGVWSQVVAVYDLGNDVTFYINGVQRAIVAGSSPAAVCTRPWYIASNGTGEKIDGRLDDVQLYGRALSGAEVAYLYSNPGAVLGGSGEIGDADDDGDVDLADYGILATCLGGAGVTPTPTLPTTLAECLDELDFDGDGDVDLEDAAVFQTGF